MTNTIELLERIGQDAALRHDSGHHLAQALADMGASEALKMAASTGNSAHLVPELGYGDNPPNHHGNQTAPVETPADEEDAVPDDADTNKEMHTSH